MDLIISNPPYINRNDLDGDEDGIWFEPPSALFSEKKGLADISTIIKNSVTFLKENGKLLIEHGFDQKDFIDEIANQNDYSDVSFLKDLNGKWRVACLTK
jgi:release factor glutamine methyltransferase